MKAALYHSFETPLVIETVSDPECPSDGIILETKANGICRSDWHGWMGHDPMIQLPHVPGHEMSGVVLEVGREVKNWRVGDRTMVPFCLGCGVCNECRSGHTHICDNDYQPGFSGWGGFAPFVAVPRADLNLTQLPEELDFVEAASLGCRFMTSFHGVVNQGQVRAGEWLVVYGCGGVGLSAIMIGAALGATVIAVDIDMAKLERATALGATAIINAATVNAKQSDVVETIKDITKGGAHVSIDALGSATTSRNSIRSLRKRGRHVQIGLTLADDANVSVPMNEVIAKELQLVGSHGMAAHHYDDMLRLILSGKVQPKKLLGKRIGLEGAGEELVSMGSFQQLGVTVIDSF
ncbi:MAG: zinc-dependent alcohol dehydrogenase family protein [Trueperaceae bacterium]